MDELAAGINEQARACAAPWRPLIVDIGVIVKDAVERLIDIGERIHPKVDRMRPNHFGTAEISWRSETVPRQWFPRLPGDDLFIGRARR